MERDIHQGVNLEASLAYREKCLADYWDALDRMAAANLALAAITHHIHLLNGEVT